MCQFCKGKASIVDYKDAALLRKFISDRGKIRASSLRKNAFHYREVSAVAKYLNRLNAPIKPVILRKKDLRMPPRRPVGLWMCPRRVGALVHT